MGTAAAVAGIAISAFSARKGRQAAKKSSQQQRDAARQGLGVQQQATEQGLQLAQEQFGQVQAGLEPFTRGAAQAFRRQQALSGALGSDLQRQAFEQFQESPGVAFLREQGLRGAGATFGAQGKLGSGERLKALTEFSQGLALQDFGNQFNRLGAVTGTGLQAALGLGGLSGQNVGLQANLLTGGAANQANLLGQQGAASALGTLGQQQASAQGLEQIAGQLPGLVTQLFPQTPPPVALAA